MLVYSFSQRFNFEVHRYGTDGIFSSILRSFPKLEFLTLALAPHAHTQRCSQAHRELRPTPADWSYVLGWRRVNHPATI